MANDPIQIEISKILSQFDVIYDRKGESKQSAYVNRTIISMTTAALAHRAVYQYKARSLRSGLGKSRVFMKGEYEKVFAPSLLDTENEDALIARCAELIIATVVLDTVRDLIPQYTDDYIKKLPIIKKSAYYLSGLLYAMNKTALDELRSNMVSDYKTGSIPLLRGKNYPKAVANLVEAKFASTLDEFERFYKSVRGVEKADIDNLLKDADFEKGYINRIDSFVKSA